MMLDTYARISIHLFQEDFNIIKKWEGFSSEYRSHCDYKGHPIILEPEV